MSRVHVDETPSPILTREEEEVRDRYTELLEEGADIEVIEPDLIRRYRELARRGASS